MPLQGVGPEEGGIEGGASPKWRREEPKGEVTAGPAPQDSGRTVGADQESVRFQGYPTPAVNGRGSGLPEGTSGNGLAVKWTEAGTGLPPTVLGPRNQDLWAETVLNGLVVVAARRCRCGRTPGIGIPSDVEASLGNRHWGGRQTLSV